jgi:predicted RNA-binding protein with TRAM domain
MVEIPDSIRSMFSGSVRKRGDSYVVEIPAGEVENGGVRLDETYRVAVLDAPTPASGSDSAPRNAPAEEPNDRGRPEPPVTEGEVRDVTVEAVGEKGDGIAKVENGYVVIVPGATPGDNPTVEIERVEENVAFAGVLRTNTR